LVYLIWLSFKPLVAARGFLLRVFQLSAVITKLLIERVSSSDQTFKLMLATLVHVYVKPEFVDDFIEATRQNHMSSVKEPGNFRFDVLQDSQDPSKFILYEVYGSESAAAAHKETLHYLNWRDAVAGWMAKPREGVNHDMLFPLLK
jgi:(4S)-4-hydroxy-5-phosphonooxypentane-2,3-dione isomerase